MLIRIKELKPQKATTPGMYKSKEQTRVGALEAPIIGVANTPSNVRNP